MGEAQRFTWSYRYTLTATCHYYNYYYDKRADHATSRRHFQIMRALMQVPRRGTSEKQLSSLRNHWDWFITLSSVRADRPLPVSVIPRMRYVQGLTKCEVRNYEERFA